MVGWKQWEDLFGQWFNLCTSWFTEELVSSTSIHTSIFTHFNTKKNIYKLLRLWHSRNNYTGSLQYQYPEPFYWNLESRYLLVIHVLFRRWKSRKENAWPEVDDSSSNVHQVITKFTIWLTHFSHFFQPTTKSLTTVTSVKTNNQWFGSESIMFDQVSVLSNLCRNQ